MRIGYARVSTEDQCLDLQHRALADAQCDLVYEDKLSGARKHRKGLSKALRRCGVGDVLIVWKLDRLGRSLFDLVRTAEVLHARGAGLKILTGQGAVIDTTTSEGRLVFGILAVMADFERELIRDRTRAGMAAARSRGVRLGRPAKIGPDQIRQARAWIAVGSQTMAEIAEGFGVHVTTLRRALREPNKG